MLIRTVLVSTILLGATGCCCCGWGDSSSSGGLRDQLEERAAEAIAEKAVELATGAEDIEIDEKSGTLTIKTDEGTAVITGSEENGSMVVTTAEGEEVRIAGGTQTELAEDFPYEVPSTSTVAFSARAEKPDGLTFMASFKDDSSRADEVYAHWKSALEAHGEVKAVDVNQDGSSTRSLVTEGPPKTTVMVVDANGQLMVQVSVEGVK